MPVQSEGSSLKRLQTYSGSLMQHNLLLMACVALQSYSGGAKQALEGAINAAMQAGVHPLHHRCLEAYTVLLSTSRVMAKQGGDIQDQRHAIMYSMLLTAAFEKMVAAGNVLQNFQAWNSDAFTDHPMMSLRFECRLHCSAGKMSCDAGEVGVMPQAGKQLSETAGLLCELVAMHLKEARGRDMTTVADANCAVPVAPTWSSSGMLVEGASTPLQGSLGQAWKILVSRCY